MNDNYTCKSNSPSRDANEDVAYAMPNPWIQWAKLGARVQKHYEYLWEYRHKARASDHKQIMDEIIQNYHILFEDVITNGAAPDEQ